jgi:hypothetical protein
MAVLVVWVSWRISWRIGGGNRKKGETAKKSATAFFESPIYLWEEMCIKFISN